MIVPVLSSSTMGPLGIAHLPRLWLKILLHACGELPEGYRHGAGGFDETLCTKLGIGRDEFVAYIENDRPDYLALEAWVVAHATDLSPQTIAEWNRRVLVAQLGETLASERRARFGIAAETVAPGVLLNDLDDWAAAHEQLTQRRTVAAP